MCGIAGFQGTFPASLLSQMNLSLAHRGPDGTGEVLLGERGSAWTGLAHRRLAIIDVSEHGRQPMTLHCDECGAHTHDDLAITYNGEIYNFPELRRELVAAGHSFHSRTDSEVLLHLYARDGLDFLARLNGIFAFALYDGRERGRPAGIERGDVVVARDGIGVKPCYYAELPAGTLFASELKALLQWPGLPRTLDAAALQQTVAYLWTPAPRTALAAVRKIQPGQALVLRGGRVQRSWFHFDVRFDGTREEHAFDEVARRVRDTVFAAVERQLVSDVPVAAFLSGGVDSSAVVAGARAAGHALQCYCIGFGQGVRASEGMAEDVPYARRVAAHLGVPLEVLELDATLMQHLERMLYFLDEPQADPAPINSLLISERARADGYKVLLSGTGGDDIFSGYRRHRALQLDGFWDRVPSAVRSILASSAKGRLRGGPGGMHAASVRRIRKLLSYVDLPADERLVAYFWWNDEQLRNALFTREFAGDDSASAMAPLLATLARVPRGEDRLNRLLYLETKHFLADHNLNYMDRTGMAAGVEIRVPLLDLEVVRLAARVPAQYKHRRGVGKAVLKRAFEADLPRDVLYRSKTGFAAPLRHWLRGDLRELVEDTLSAATLRNRGIFEPAAVRALIDADRAGIVDGCYTLFSLICIELWCRLFVDRPSAAMTAAPLAANAVAV